MKTLIIIAIILAILMLTRKEMWDNMPWAKEHYSEPTLQERSVP